jgi:predicted metal-dependent phosphoesterase TrpH
MLKADLHVHSIYSFDCRSALKDIVDACLMRKISCVALADHASADGGIALQKIAPFKVIIAEEILTPDGEIMGMFLKTTIESPLPAEEAISRIRDQGGLVCIPHPYDRLRAAALRGKALERMLRFADIVEAYNSRSHMPGVSARIVKLAASRDLPVTAGSDAHTTDEIGSSYIEMEDYESPAEFLLSLRNGKVTSRSSNPVVHLASTLAKLRSK